MKWNIVCRFGEGDTFLPEVDETVERHGTEAEMVRAALTTGQPPQRWRCKDGKEYLFKYRSDGRVDLMVVRSGVEITAFPTSAGYLAEVLQQDQCSQCNGPIPAPAY